MVSKISQQSEFSSPLLSTGNVESQGYDVGSDVGQRQSETSSIPPTLLLSTLVAVFGSYVFGAAVSCRF